MDERHFHTISAKKMGWEDQYVYFAYPTDRFTKEAAMADFVPVQKECLKNDHWCNYTAYEHQGETYYKIIYTGVFSESELIDQGISKENLDQL